MTETRAPNVPHGDCEVTRTVDRWGEIRMRIDKADPRIRIAAELLQEISANNTRGETRNATLDGDVLTLSATNRTVIYRINWDDWDAATNTYSAEWPD